MTDSASENGEQVVHVLRIGINEGDILPANPKYVRLHGSARTGQPDRLKSVQLKSRYGTRFSIRSRRPTR